MHIQPVEQEKKTMGNNFSDIYTAVIVLVKGVPKLFALAKNLAFIKKNLQFLSNLS